MKRCPKCSRTYSTNTQKFCTHDGVVLENIEVGSETVRIEATDLDDDAPTKAISRELVSEITGDFDPLKTVMSRPDGTFTGAPRKTQDLSSPAEKVQPTPAAPTSDPVPQTPPYAQSSPSAPTMALTGSGPIAASAPLPPPPQSTPLPPPPAAAPPQTKKKSRLPLVLGILVVLLLLGAGVLGAGYFFVLRPMLARRTTVEPQPSPPPVQTATPTVAATPND